MKVDQMSVKDFAELSGLLDHLEADHRDTFIEALEVGEDGTLEDLHEFHDQRHANA